MDDLAKILAAREQRWNMRKKLAAACSGCVITMTLCLPLTYRTSGEFLAMFHKMSKVLIPFLHQRGITADFADMQNGADGPALFFTSSFPASLVKAACVQAEENLPGGRMLDIDVMEKSGKPIGRKELGLAPRACFVCGEAAHLCMAGARHRAEELAVQIEKMAAALRLA
ncbi:MAG: citrate lyase holo-[acyl-carrier protein] synthase [Clostridia bacterium]|nr:citrate lyase holo-[acyl-carrier protein] synthase [Clostridia bacterium]